MIRIIFYSANAVSCIFLISSVSVQEKNVDRAIPFRIHL